MAELEKIPSGARFSSERMTVQKDHVFGWVFLQKDAAGNEEAWTFDEIEEDVFLQIVEASSHENFPQEFREFLRQLDPRHRPYRKLH